MRSSFETLDRMTKDDLIARVQELESVLFEDPLHEMVLAQDWTLTPREITMLMVLLRRAGTPIHVNLLNITTSPGQVTSEAQTENNARVYIYRLRRKTRLPIETIYGYGYLLTKQTRKDLFDAYHARQGTLPLNPDHCRNCWRLGPDVLPEVSHERAQRHPKTQRPGAGHGQGLGSMRTPRA